MGICNSFIRVSNKLRQDADQGKKQANEKENKRGINLISKTPPQNLGILGGVW